MAATVEDFATSESIDWDKDFIWVQNTSLLKIISDDEGAMLVQRHDGARVTLVRSEAESSYFRIRDAAYLKPVYAPCKAHVLAEDHYLKVQGHDQLFPQGSAILRQPSGFIAVHADDIMRDYEAVSEPSDNRFPETPFHR